SSATNPVRTDPLHHAAFAFVRSSLDPAIKGLEDKNLRLWEPAHQASINTFFKPSEGDYDIILDCGGPAGLQHTPLLRVYCGRGYYLLCQMPVLSSFEQEPAAAHLLQSLLSSLNSPVPQPSQFAALTGDPERKLAEALHRAGIPVHTDAANTPLLMVNGRETLSRETLALLKERLQKGGSVMLNGLTKENASLLSQMAGFEISMSPSAVHQLLRMKQSPLDAGLSNQDLCWFQGDDFYKMICAQMSAGNKTHQTKGDAMLDGELAADAPGVESPFSPSGLLCVPLFKGRLILFTIAWENFLVTQPIKARRVITTLLHNAGCKVSKSSGVVRTYASIDMKALVNRGFWNRKETKVPGWFGDPKDDLRYFPVNVTGNDPVLNMPQPPDEFPKGMFNYAGVDFEVINPEANNGRSCLVINGGESASIPVNATGDSVWMLGAMDKMGPDSTEAARVTFTYAGGTKASTPVRAGIDLNGYQYIVPVLQGLCAWTGPTPSRPDAVLWCWRIANPEPEKEIISLTIDNGKDPMGIIAVSRETDSK
ncbi:MAG: hypothetical protein WAX69_15510, partial [Victivallales bacterium]